MINAHEKLTTTRMVLEDLHAYSQRTRTHGDRASERSLGHYVMY